MKNYQLILFSIPTSANPFDLFKIGCGVKIDFTESMILQKQLFAINNFSSYPPIYLIEHHVSIMYTKDDL